MKNSKLFLRISFLTLVSFLFISSRNINKKTNKINNIAIEDFYSLNNEKLSAIFFTINVKGLLSSDIDEDNLFALALNIDTDEDENPDEIIMILPKKGRMYFYGPFSGAISQKSYVYDSSTLLGDVLITPTYSEPITSVDSGLKLYAGIKSQEESSLFDYLECLIFNTSIKTETNYNVTNIILELPKNILTNSKTQSFNAWIDIKRW